MFGSQGGSFQREGENNPADSLRIFPHINPDYDSTVGRVGLAFLSIKEDWRVTFTNLQDLAICPNRKRWDSSS